MYLNIVYVHKCVYKHVCAHANKNNVGIFLKYGFASIMSKYSFILVCRLNVYIFYLLA